MYWRATGNWTAGSAINPLPTGLQGGLLVLNGDKKFCCALKLSKQLLGTHRRGIKTPPQLFIIAAQSSLDMGYFVTAKT